MVLFKVLVIKLLLNYSVKEFVGEVISYNVFRV